jgi:hypothetical protein
MGSEYIPLSSGKKRMEPAAAQERRLKNPCASRGREKAAKNKTPKKKNRKGQVLFILRLLNHIAYFVLFL